MPHHPDHLARLQLGGGESCQRQLQLGRRAAAPNTTHPIRRLESDSTVAHDHDTARARHALSQNFDALAEHVPGMVVSGMCTSTWQTGCDGRAAARKVSHLHIPDPQYKRMPHKQPRAPPRTNAQLAVPEAPAICQADTTVSAAVLPA